jgi:branched-subunit amino acid aminotransferase/4-amino-4-deoxychorismate lyase
VGDAVVTDGPSDGAPCVFDGVVIDAGVVPLRADGGLVSAGLGVFETTTVVDARPKFLARRLVRMAAGMRLLELGPPPTEEVARSDVAALAAARGEATFALRYSVFDDGGRLRRLAVGFPLPPIDEDGARLVRAGAAFDGPRALAAAKSLNYAKERLAHGDAARRGADEALFVDANGRVLEGARSNVFCVFRGVATTPPTTAPILPGIVRAVLLDAARKAGVAVAERDFDVGALAAADEVFLTSSLRGPRRVVSYEGRPVGRADAPVFERLLSAYRAAFDAD